MVENTQGGQGRGKFMNSDAGSTELIIVLAVMLALLVFGFVAVGIFVWVWRKERK